MAEKEDAMIPACKNCKWMQHYSWWERLFGSLTGATCHHPKIGPKAPTVDLVTGKVEALRWNFCSVNRMHSGTCGFDGQFWEIT